MNESRSWIIRAGSVLGVVLSLLFVGVELRQNTLAQRAETRQALADASREFVLSVADNDDVMRSYYGRYRPDLLSERPWPELSFADTLRAQTVMYANLRNLENVFLQSIEGVVGDAALATYGFPPSRLYTSAAFAQDWLGFQTAFDPRFISAFDQANSGN